MSLPISSASAAFYPGESPRASSPRLRNSLEASAAQESDGASPKKVDSSRDPLSDKTVFLQLLVSQIKYQNPLEPADSIQYVTQLNQFSATEQLVEIRKLLDPSTKQAEEKTGGQF